MVALGSVALWLHDLWLWDPGFGWIGGPVICGSGWMEALALALGVDG